jgi:hypothetical protein
MAAREPNRRAGEALANSPQLRLEVARMRVDFRRQGKNADHLSDQEILDGIQEAGSKLPRVSDRPGGASFAEAKRRFAASLPDLGETAGNKPA